MGTNLKQDFLSQKVLNMNAEIAKDIFNIISKEKWSIIQDILKTEVDINHSDSQGKTLLMYAIDNDDNEVVQNLCGLNPAINKKDNNGKTALLYAIDKGKVGAVRSLIESGADLRLCDNKGINPLKNACVVGNLEIVGMIVSELSALKGKKSRPATTNLRPSAVVLPAKEEITDKNIPSNKSEMFQILRSYFSNSAWNQIQESMHSAGATTAYKRYLTVLFIDLAGFSTLSEQLEPELVIDVLNYFFSRVVYTIKQFQGDVDKFIGDAMLVTFDSPENAVRCAMHILLTDLPHINTEFESSETPDLQIHMGMNTGWVIQGNIGSYERRETTVIGDGVNIASRLQQLTPPNEMWITASTLTGLGNLKNMFEPVDRLKLKGKIQKVMPYRFVRRIPADRRVVNFETNDAMQKLLRDEMTKIGIKKIISTEKVEHIEEWIGHSDVKAIVAGPSIDHYHLEIIKSMINSKSLGIPIIPVVKKQIDSKTKALYEKIGAHIHVPLYGKKPFEKMEGVIINQEVKDTPKIEGYQSPKDIKIARNGSHTSKKTKPQQPTESKDTSVYLTETPKSEGSSSHLPEQLKGKANLQVISDEIITNINDHIEKEQLELIKDRLRKIWVYSMRKKQATFTFDLTGFKTENIQEENIKNILDIFDFVSKMDIVKIRIFYPPSLNSIDFDKIREEYRRKLDNLEFVPS